MPGGIVHVGKRSGGDHGRGGRGEGEVLLEGSRRGDNRGRSLSGRYQAGRGHLHDWTAGPGLLRWSGQASTREGHHQHLARSAMEPLFMAET